MENNSRTISYQEYPKEPVVLDNLSIKFMKQSVFVPLALNDDTLRVAMDNPDDFYTVDALKIAYGVHIDVIKGRRDDILSAIDTLYGAGSQSLETIIEEADKDVYELSVTGDDDVDHLRDMASEAPIIRLVNRLILNAVEMSASDIHFEPFEREFKVRYRIDGVLHDMDSPPGRLQAAIISRVKIMAKLDIAERRLPRTMYLRARRIGQLQLVKRRCGRKY